MEPLGYETIFHSTSKLASKIRSQHEDLIVREDFESFSPETETSLKISFNHFSDLTAYIYVTFTDDIMFFHHVYPMIVYLTYQYFLQSKPYSLRLWG